MNTLSTLRNRLAMLEASKMLGICYLDDEGKLVQLFDDNSNLSAVILEGYRCRIQELEKQGADTKGRDALKKTLNRQGLVAPD